MSKHFLCHFHFAVILKIQRKQNYTHTQSSFYLIQMIDIFGYVKLGFRMKFAFLSIFLELISAVIVFQKWIKIGTGSTFVGLAVDKMIASYCREKEEFLESVWLPGNQLDGFRQQTANWISTLDIKLNMIIFFPGNSKLVFLCVFKFFREKTNERKKIKFYKKTLISSWILPEGKKVPQFGSILRLENSSSCLFNGDDTQTHAKSNTSFNQEMPAI